ncbi:MAG TPA: LysR substrate-binding domain-containing protein [Burkholderiales bacterium]|nr:LysR substrate-binding domain-containing protein [Burkholderiales bacterium]
MDLKQLSYFVHIADSGSFTRAAALLDIAQPALSRQVRRLEVELRQTLLKRNGRGVTLTDAGARLLEHGRGILHQVERAREDLEEMRGAPVGHAALGVPPTVGRLLTAALVAEFQQRFAKATLGIVEGLSTHVLEWLRSGRIDIGLVYNPPPSPFIDTAPLVPEPLFLIGPAGARRRVSRQGAPVALKQLAAHRLILPSRPHAVRMFVESSLAAIGERIEVAWEVDGIPAILDLVARGHGHAVLSLNAIRNDPARERLLAHPIVKPRLVTTLSIATSSQRPLTPLARQVVALLRTVAPRELGQARVR